MHIKALEIIFLKARLGPTTTIIAIIINIRLGYCLLCIILMSVTESENLILQSVTNFLISSGYRHIKVDI